MKKQFQIGDKVAWKARDTDPTHQGTVTHIIPASVAPDKIIGNRYDKFCRDHKIMFDIYSEKPMETYIVVTGKGKRGGKASAYRPLVSNLQLVSQ